MDDPTLADSRRHSIQVAPLPHSDRLGGALPTPLTSFVGREHEVAALTALLRRDDVRLVTLTGPGGVGKTRLALRTAAELGGRQSLVTGHVFADGVCFIDLSPLTDPELVLPAIAQALGLRAAGDRPAAAQLASWLANRRLLLVLDNVEQVVEAAPYLTAMLASCPSVKILTTSRIVLRLAAEYVLPIGPLALPPARPEVRGKKSVEDFTASAAHHSSVVTSDAVTLFVQRAQAVEPSFALTESNASIVAEIVHRVEGLPLALELAASRIRQLPPTALLGQLTERLRVLTGGPRDAPARQRTLRNAIAWSYELLSADDQALFRRIAVFVGGCTPEAAAVVANPDSELSIDVLDGLFSLVDHSLLRRVEATRVGEGGDEPRFRMLESIRDFALERLVESGEIEEVRSRYAGFVAEFAASTAPPWKPPSARTIALLASEHDNARAVLAWAVERGEAEIGLRVATSYFRFWQLRGHLSEGARWLELVLALSGSVPPTLRAAALIGLGSVGGERDGTPELAYREALAIAQTLDGPELPLVLIHLGDVARDRCDFDEAESWYHQALERSRATAEEDWVFRGLCSLGYVAADRGDLVTAVTLVEESAAICRSAGYHWGLVATLGALSIYSRCQGDRRRAASLDRERLPLSCLLGSWFHIAECCLMAADAANWLRLPERATRLLGAATALIEETGSSLPPDGQSEIDVMVTEARATLGEEAFSAVWSTGRTLPLNEVAAEADAIFALEETASVNPPVPPVPLSDAVSHDLSPRELEVVQLLAAGQSNREIADALFISHGTATTHVRNILGKLNLDSRTAVAAWAIRHGLA